MPGDKAFVDTNVLIYMYSDAELVKQQRAFETLNEYDRYVSTY